MTKELNTNEAVDESKENETKSTPHSREERRKKRERMYRRLDDQNKYKEVLDTKGAFIMSRKKVRKNAVEEHMVELMTLVGKSKRPMLSDAEIGKMFREIVNQP